MNEKVKYKCPHCGCNGTGWEMGGFWIGYHYQGCPDWNFYVDAGPAPSPAPIPHNHRRVTR